MCITCRECEKNGNVMSKEFIPVDIILMIKIPEESHVCDTWNLFKVERSSKSNLGRLIQSVIKCIWICSPVENEFM